MTGVEGVKEARLCGSAKLLLRFWPQSCILCDFTHLANNFLQSFLLPQFAVFCFRSNVYRFLLWLLWNRIA